MPWKNEIWEEMKKKYEKQYKASLWDCSEPQEPLVWNVKKPSIVVNFLEVVGLPNFLQEPAMTHLGSKKELTNM